ncbi:hypothetical protein FJT64_018089 [Amphibalanus amphitrite]|uniref:Uncharacterized protein n=1 Tax=Amphibalanus amphitrite TaxID=1232801 RepID=A0A6A4X9L9_AMPAM|nr:hypothetical protein FJT64_018089 [Amphibalanus amphitrite]
MWRRLELYGKDLYVNESLTPLRGKIYRSLLNARREKKLHTVFTRGGQLLENPPHAEDTIVACTDSQSALAAIRGGWAAQHSSLGVDIWRALWGLTA